MIDIEKIKQEIIKNLKPLNPYKVILFGSYAYGTPTKDSDLDICIIEKRKYLKENKNLKLEKLLKI